MRRLKIYSIGKTKEKWLDEAIEEYLKRLKPFLKIEFFFAKDNTQLLDWSKKEPSLICLDPEGTLYSSEKFSSFLQQKWDKEGAQLAIVIGGADGLPSELREKGELLSLSPLTFTHQMTRLILIEQIYRAIEIQKGSGYHK